LKIQNALSDLSDKYNHGLHRWLLEDASSVWRSDRGLWGVQKNSSSQACPLRQPRFALSDLPNRQKDSELL